MAKLTITSVVDDIETWSNEYGTFYKVAAFAGKELVFASKKDYDAALALQGELKEVIGKPIEVVVEHAGTSKNDHAKWKLKEIVGAGSSDGLARGTAATSAPSNEASIRAAVALKAAASMTMSAGGAYPVGVILSMADDFDAWLAKKSGAVEQGSSLSEPGVAAAPAPGDQSDGGVTEAYGEGVQAPSSDDHVHEPDTSVEAKAGRYPCACGLWVKP